jgi:hypothetical protein
MASKKRTADGVIKKNPLVTVELDESIREDEMCEFTAQISANGQGVGNARLIWIERDNGNFQLSCDHHSDELHRIASFICDGRGKAKHQLSIHGYDQPGPFLYIQSLSLGEAWRQDTFVGADALRKMLNHPKLPEWTLAVYEPDSASQMTPKEVHTMHSRLQNKETYQEQKEWKKKIARLCRQDARQFIRAGFRQVMPPSLARGDYYHFFAIPSFLQGDMMTNADAQAVSIVEAPERTLPPVGLDLQLRDLINSEMMAGVSSLMFGGTPPPRDYKSLETAVQRLVTEGATIERSFALHVCARAGKLAEMDVLLKVAGANARQAMNAKNEDGDTPLMVAARSAVSGVLMHNPFGPPVKPLGICKEMMERGADKSITDVSGLTALGHMRKYAMESMSFVGGYHTAMDMVEPLSRLLMPTTGPTLADNATLQAVAEAAAFRRDEFDDDDDNDNDGDY